MNQWTASEVLESLRTKIACQEQVEDPTIISDWACQTTLRNHLDPYGYYCSSNNSDFGYADPVSVRRFLCNWVPLKKSIIKTDSDIPDSLTRFRWGDDNSDNTVLGINRFLSRARTTDGLGSTSGMSSKKYRNVTIYSSSDGGRKGGEQCSLFGPVDASICCEVIHIDE